MAFLKQTYVSGNLYVTGSSDQIIGNLQGTASYATVAKALDGDAEYTVKDLHVKGNATVDGDLKVKGDLTYVGVKDLRVKDKQIDINANESGSAVASADQAGIVIKNTDAAGDITVLWDAASETLKFNKKVDATVTKADEASKVTYALKQGDGISAVEYDGSAEKTISVDTEWLKNQQAGKVGHKLSVTANDYLTASANFDGSADVTLTLDLSKETDRIAALETATGSLQDQITTEVDRAKAAEKTNADNLTAEITRAKAAEEANTASISSEVTRAKAAEKTNADAIAAEVTARENAVSGLDDRITAVEDILPEDATTLATKTEVEAVQTNLTTEISRAKAAEGTNATNITKNATAITAEEARAKGVEEGLDSRLEVVEGKIPTAASTTNQLADKKYVDDADAVNTTAITAEETRAKAAEEANTTAITAEVTDRKAAITAEETRADNKYVAKAGDTMTGALNMGVNEIKFGDMSIKWDATAGAIVFVSNS